MYVRTYVHICSSRSICQLSQRSNEPLRYLKEACTFSICATYIHNKRTDVRSVVTLLSAALVVGATGTSDRTVTPSSGTSTPPPSLGTPPTRTDSTGRGRQPSREVVPGAVAVQRRSSDRIGSSPSSRQGGAQLVRQASASVSQLERSGSRTNSSPVSRG